MRPPRRAVRRAQARRIPAVRARGKGGEGAGQRNISRRRARNRPGMTRIPRIAAAAALAATYGLAVRPRLLRWGATDPEVRRPFPGAEVIPGGRRGATMAVTIEAPPSRV